MKITLGEKTTREALAELERLKRRRLAKRLLSSALDTCTLAIELLKEEKKGDQE